MFGEDSEPEDRTLMFLPHNVYHKIDEDSPLYNLGPRVRST